MAAEKIIFETNIAVPLALAFARGKESPSQYTEKTGDPIMEWYYSTTDDRCFYARAGLHEKIVALAPAVGEAFTITKKEVKQRGKKPFPEWQVARLEQSVARPTAPVATTQSSLQKPDGAISPQRNTSTTPIDQARPYARSAAQEPPPLPSPPPDHRTAPPEKIPIDQALTELLLVAGRSTRETETILGAEGGSVRFDSRDVAAIATSVLIQCFKEGRISLTRFAAKPPATQPATPAPAAAASAPKPPGSATTATIEIPWNTRGTMRRSFLDLRPALGAERYLAELERFGVSAPENFSDEAAARACYRRMVELLREVA